MPIYEYQCENCKKQFEEFQNIADKPLKKCRFCAGKVRRLISNTSFSLKGSGWYKDGYSKPKPGKDNTAKSGVQASKTSSTETKAKVSKEGS